MRRLTAPTAPTAEGDKRAIAHTRFLWVDVDEPGQLPALWELLAERPCHLLIESGGSGGAHAYWKLDEPLAATRAEPGTGELTEPIERANLRLIHHLGVDDDGRPNVGDAACKERARMMRLAGTVNYKTGQHARIVEADFALPAYTPAELVGDLPDPAPTAPAPALEARAGRRTGTRTSGSRRRSTSSDWPTSPCRAAGWSAAPPRGTTTSTPHAA